jgi:hypothetical protein
VLLSSQPFAKEPMVDNPTASIVTILDRHLDETLARWEHGAAPVWEGQAEFGRALITLSSSSLVLSISVVQLLADKIENPQGVWLLPAAWILFGTTVMAGALRHSWSSQARSFRMRFENERGEMRKQVARLDLTAPDLPERFDAILVDAYSRATAEPAKAGNVHQGLTQAMFWSFALGLTGLLTFAILNLPF